MMVKIFISKKGIFKKIDKEDIKKYLADKESSIWINLESSSNEEISFLKDKLNIHPTTIEDIFSEQTSSKYEDLDDYNFIVFQGIKKIENFNVETYNISFIQGKNFLISFCNQKESVINELLKNDRKIQTLLNKGETYIFHYLLDKSVDHYLKIKIETNGEFQKLEKDFLNLYGKDFLSKIYSWENLFIELRHLSESITDLCLTLLKPNEQEKELVPYFQDVYDHALKTKEGYETILKRIDGLEEWYATMTNLKTNEIISYLTVLTAIMMPLTIIPGIYGMNINLPFQNSKFSFLIVAGIMLFLTLIMIIISIKVGWIEIKKKKLRASNP